MLYVSFIDNFTYLDFADFKQTLKQLQLPIVPIGQYDNQKWGYTQEYLDLFPHHQLVIIPNAGHSIATEQPELYLNTIRTFIN